MPRLDRSFRTVVSRLPNTSKPAAATGFTRACWGGVAVARGSVYLAAMVDWFQPPRAGFAHVDHPGQGLFCVEGSK